MKAFDFEKPKFNHLFQNVIKLTNSFQMRRMDFTHKVINEQMQD